MGFMPCEPSDSGSQVREIGTHTAFSLQVRAYASANSSCNTLQFQPLRPTRYIYQMFKVIRAQYTFTVLAVNLFALYLLDPYCHIHNAM
jgi:hypothetical protein